jgi:tape measure domain-containing protein
MLGSADKAKSLLMQISSFAAATPFELPQVVEGGKNLLAFGVSMDQIIPTFTMLGNIAAGVGTDKLPGLINVFGQVKAAGRLMSQDLLQFTSAGVPVIDLLAQHYGITSDKVKDLVATGKVGFDDLNASLSLLGGPSGKWGDLMEKQSKSLNGTLSNVQDNLGRILRQAVGIGPDGDIRQGSLFDFVTKGATGLMNGLSKLQPFIDKIANFFEKKSYRCHCSSRRDRRHFARRAYRYRCGDRLDTDCYRRWCRYHWRDRLGDHC